MNYAQQDDIWYFNVVVDKYNRDIYSKVNIERFFCHLKNIIYTDNSASHTAFKTMWTIFVKEFFNERKTKVKSNIKLFLWRENGIRARNNFFKNSENYNFEKLFYSKKTLPSSFLLQPFYDITRLCEMKPPVKPGASEVWDNRGSYTLLFIISLSGKTDAQYKFTLWSWGKCQIL